MTTNTPQTSVREKVREIVGEHQDFTESDMQFTVNKILTIFSQQLDTVEEAKNNAYRERNQLVAALTRLYPSWLGYHKDKDWEDDWRTIVYIKIPVTEKVVSGDQHNQIPEKHWFKTTEKQISWHIHDSEKPLFAHLDPGLEEWDGHTTEEKYRRLSLLKSNLNK